MKSNWTNNPGPRLRNLLRHTCSSASVANSTSSRDDKSADPDCASHHAIFPDGNAAAPADESWITVVGNVMAFFGMSHFFSDFFCRLAFPGSSPCFICSNSDRGDRRAVHAGECDQFAMRVRDSYYEGLLQVGSLLNDQVDDLLSLGVFDDRNIPHAGWRKPIKTIFQCRIKIKPSWAEPSSASFQAS